MWEMHFCHQLFQPLFREFKADLQKHRLFKKRIYDLIHAKFLDPLLLCLLHPIILLLQ